MNPDELIDLDAPELVPDVSLVQEEEAEAALNEPEHHVTVEAETPALDQELTPPDIADPETQDPITEPMWTYFEGPQQFEFSANFVSFDAASLPAETRYDETTADHSSMIYSRMYYVGETWLDAMRPGDGDYVLIGSGPIDHAGAFSATNHNDYIVGIQLGQSGSFELSGGGGHDYFSLAASGAGLRVDAGTGSDYVRTAMGAFTIDLGDDTQSDQVWLMNGGTGEGNLVIENFTPGLDTLSMYDERQNANLSFRDSEAGTIVSYKGADEVLLYGVHQLDDIIA